MSKPLCLDLCCGLGGWASGFIAEGWDVLGVDLCDFSKQFPGRFVQADLLTWNGWQNTTTPPLIVVASTPCDEFSRWSMPWTRAKNPPVPSLALWRRAQFIASTLGVPLIQENVKGAQRFVGKSAMNCGPFHLWGDVPAIVPYFSGRKKESYGSKQKAERAKIPLDLARWIASCYFPS
jgi:hypothetical protein